MNPAIIIGILPQLIETVMKLYQVVIENGQVSPAEKERMISEMKKMQNRIKDLEWRDA